ncbi:MAG: 50S ribosome-binding GTPase [Acidaminococcaceae bacterium]|jgi:GTP-binding protein EngB required for normal cell division|nr:50S ribosome-binding GTPase [Acidaminococcaceae bacterium]
MNTEIEALKIKIAKLDKDKVTIVFFGQPGGGKSSVINAICGEKVVDVGVGTDTTRNAIVVEHGDVVFVDLPGYGTNKFPQKDFFEEFDPLQYDMFVCVFDGKLHKADTEFFQKLQRLKKPCIFVRNKTDEIYDEDLSLEASEEIIKEDVAKQLGINDFILIFVAAREDKLDGIGKLNDAIMSKMDAARREKYILAAEAQTEEQLRVKKTAALQFVKNCASYAAFNGLNPMLGLDAAVDMMILNRMCHGVRKSFGITAAMVEESSLSNNNKAFILKSMSKEGIKYLFKILGRKFATKTVLKYIPIVGQASAAFMGRQMIITAGQDYVEVCYRVIKEKMLRDLNAKR